MRHIDYNFNGTSLEIPSDMLYHELLVVVDGVIKAPHNKFGCSGDYKIDGNCVIFEKWLEGACVQLIPVTDAILEPSKSHQREERNIIKLRDWC